MRTWAFDHSMSSMVVRAGVVGAIEVLIAHATVLRVAGERETAVDVPRLTAPPSPPVRPLFTAASTARG